MVSLGDSITIGKATNIITSSEEIMQNLPNEQYLISFIQILIRIKNLDADHFRGEQTITRQLEITVPFRWQII